MSDISCKTCPFWTNNYCHHVSNATDSTVSPNWWCSEHPLAPGQRDRIAEIALNGLLSEHACRHELPLLIECMYEIADGVMAERAKGKP